MARKGPGLDNYIWARLLAGFFWPDPKNPESDMG